MLQKLGQPEKSAAAQPPSTSAVSLACPHCGADLDFPAGSARQTLQTVCAYCGAEVVLGEHGLQVVSTPEPLQVEAPAGGEVPDLFEYTHDGEVDDERLAALTKDDLVQFIVRELGSEADRNELIRQVCEKGGMSWHQAETFVARVTLENEREIVKRRSPFMAALSVATLVGGVILAFLSGYAMLAYFSSEPLVRLDYALYGLLSGLGMTAGGLIGVVRMVKSLRDTDY